MKFGGNKEHNYVTHTLAEHHRIVREGNRFKADISKLKTFISSFLLRVSVAEGKKGKDKGSRKEGRPRKKGKPEKKPVMTENEKMQHKQRKKANERLGKIKRGSRKRMSRAEVDTALKASLMRLSDWSQRACDIMQQQMKDITKLYMATMDYNIHLNSAYPVSLSRKSLQR